jgi:hypothetical protein
VVIGKLGCEEGAGITGARSGSKRNLFGRRSSYICTYAYVVDVVVKGIQLE